MAVAMSLKSQAPRKQSIQQASHFSTAGVTQTHEAKTVQHTGNGVENAISSVILSYCVKKAKLSKREKQQLPQGALAQVEACKENF